MSKLTGFIFIFLGGIVTYTSYYVGPKLRLFFWIGLGLLGFGVFQLIVSFVLQETATKKFKREVEKQLEKPRVIRCPQCKTPVYARANFCYHCGNKLR